MASSRQEPRAWRDDTDAENQRLSIMPIEDIPVAGADVPFEELLTRELRKSQENRSKSVKKKTKKAFLKKGARGWWMQRPDAKKKVMKHILTSNEEVEIMKMSMMHKKNQQSEGISFSTPLSKPCLLGPKPMRTVGNTLQTLSPPVSPIRQTHYYNDQIGAKVPQLVTQNNNFAAWKDASLRSTTSTDIMGTQNLRQSYEANQEREANDIAEFEAIERNLAAEKSAFLVEKQQHQQDRSVEYREHIYRDKQSGANDWGLPYSSFVSDLHEQEETKRQTTRRDSSFDDSLNEKIESALAFDDYSVLSKDGAMSEQDGFTGQLRDHFGYGNRYGDPSSDLSAVSFDDSVPWDDDSSLQPPHKQSLNVAGLVVSPNKRDCLTSEGARHQATKHEGYCAERGGDRTNALGHKKSGIPDCIPKSDAPDSSLMQQMFEVENNTSISPSYEDDMSSIGDSTNINRAWRDQSPPPPPPVQDSSLSNLKHTLQDKQKPPFTSRAKGDDKRTSHAKRKTTASSRVPSTGSSNDTRTNSRDQSAHVGIILPAVIEEKLYELETEVKFYKSETRQLQKQKNYYDQEMKKLALEREKFERFQQKQRLSIEKEWERERTNMKKEAKLQERQWKLRMNTAISHQDREDRGQLETLKAEIVKMRKAGNDNLRQRVLELEEKNRELTDEIRFLEKDRLAQRERYERLLEKRQESLGSASQSGVHSLHSEKDELRMINGVFVTDETTDKLLQKWNYPHERSTKPHEQNDTTASSANQSRVQSNAVDSYNRKQYSIDRENPQSLSDSRTLPGGTELDGPNAKDTAIASDADHALASNATYEWALPAAENVEVQPNLGYADEKCNNCEEDDAISASASSLSEHKVVTQEIEHTGGKKEFLYMDGSRKILFPDGNEKTIDTNGHTVIKFTNGDHKEVFPDTGVSVYYYYEAQTKLTTYADNRKVYEFPNQQIETSLPDGRTEIQFPDGIKKTIHPDGDEFSVFPDGTTMLEQQSGLREVTLLNQKKIRYYPDGQMSCVSLSGQETRLQSDFRAHAA